MRKSEENHKTAMFFYGEHCIHCHHLRPLFFAKCTAKKIECKEIDAEKDTELVEKFGIRSVPYAIVMDGLEVVDMGHAADVMARL